jgi:antitoxin component of MazEF toxin-antitoxin module
MALVGKVRIPKAVIEKARLKERDSLEVEAVAEGLVELRRPAKLPTLAQLVGQITPENRYGKISTGSEVGKLRLGLHERGRRLVHRQHDPLHQAHSRAVGKRVDDGALDWISS